MHTALVTLCSAKVIWLHEADAHRFSHTMPAKVNQSHNTDASRFGHTMPAKVIQSHNTDASPFGHAMPAKVIRLYNADETAIVSQCRQFPALECAVKSHGCNTIAFQR